jgi:hypothetical protein
MMRFAWALASCAALAATMMAPAAGASADTQPTVSVALPLTAESGLGTVYVELETPQDVNAQGVPQELTDSPVTTATVTGGGTAQISIPVTAAVLAQAPDGLATFEFFTWFGSSEATSTETLPVTAAASATDPPADGTPTAALSAFTQQSQDVTIPPPCEWRADGSAVEESDRIGQMQVSTAPGSEARWTYNTQADSTFGVGVSASATSGYSVDGSFTVTNTIGSSGGFTGGPGFNRYVDGHFYRQRYISDGFCGHLYKAKIVSAVGDSYAGTNKPPTDPYGRCGNDPNGLAAMDANGGFYGSDRGRATDYSGAASIYNLSVSGRTGYTDDIHIDYTNNSSGTEYVCGNGELPHAPIMWSNDSSGH